MSNTYTLLDNFETLDALRSRLFLPPSLSSFGASADPGLHREPCEATVLTPRPRLIAQNTQNTFMYPTSFRNTIHLRDIFLLDSVTHPQILRLTNYLI